MPFDLSTAKPVSSSFDLSTAKLAEDNQEPQQEKLPTPEQAAEGLFGFDPLNFARQAKGVFDVGANFAADIPSKVIAGSAAIGGALRGEDPVQIQQETRERLTPEIGEEGQGILSSIGAGLESLSKIKGIDEIIKQAKSAGEVLTKVGEITGGLLADPMAAVTGQETEQARFGSQVGSSIAQALPETALEAAALGQAAGKATKLVSRSNQRIPQTASQRRKLIADEIKAGNPNIDNVTKMISESGDIVTNKPAKAALKVLGGKKSIKAQQTVSVLENMNDATRLETNKMLDIIEQARKEPIFNIDNRPADILGKAIAKRGQEIGKLNKGAGKAISKISKGIKEPVDITSISDDFFNKLSEKGVKFSTAEDGWITPDFSRSKFSGGSKQQLTTMINDLSKGKMSFNSAHELKQAIRDNVDFDKLGSKKLTRDSESLLKELSADINTSLRSKSKAYSKANDDFAKTVGLKNSFNKMAGKDLDGNVIDIFEDAGAESLGGKAMRLASNAASRPAIKKALTDADKVLKGFNKQFDDDIPSLIHAVTELETIFKIEPAGSFQGRTQRAGANLLDKSPTKKAADLALGKAFELAEPDFNKTMKVLRELTKQKGAR